MLQLNSVVTRSLATSLGRFTSATPTSNLAGRLIFVRDTVALPADMSPTNLRAYFEQFMLNEALSTTNSNYLGSAIVGNSYSYYANTVTMNSLAITPNPDIAGGTIGSVVYTVANGTGAPFSDASVNGFSRAWQLTMFITDSISTIDSPKMVVFDNQLTISPSSYPTVQNITISMVSAS